MAQARERVLHLLSLTGHKRLVSAVASGLRRASAEVDAKIAELVDATLERELAPRVVPLFEHLSLRERADAARQFADGVSQVERDPLAAIVELGDPSIVGHAMLVYKERFQERYPRIWEENAPLIPLFERMAFLRTVPIFEEMPDRSCAASPRCSPTSRSPAGEVIFKKGDPGDALYIVRRGCGLHPRRRDRARAREGAGVLRRARAARQRAAQRRRGRRRGHSMLARCTERRFPRAHGAAPADPGARPPRRGPAPSRTRRGRITRAALSSATRQAMLPHAARPHSRGVDRRRRGVRRPGLPRQAGLPLDPGARRRRAPRR